MLFRLLFRCLFPVLLTGASVVFFHTSAAPYVFTFSIIADQDGEAELFWTKKHTGFNKDQSAKKRIYKGPNTIEFVVPEQKLDYIRLDPSSDNSETLIKAIKIDRGIHSAEWTGASLSEFIPHTTGTIASQEEDGLRVSNISGDPGILSPRVRPGKNVFLLSAITALLSAAVLLTKDLLRPGAPDRDLTKTNVILPALVVFILMVVFKLHGSSIDIWQHHLTETDTSVILGEARSIRSDEWLGSTPALLSQLNQTPALNPHNPSLSAADGPLVYGLPVSHFSLLFRPWHWGFYFLDTERAFSFFWNIRLLFCFLGVFLLCHTLSGGRTVPALALSLMFFFSSCLQWWQSTSLPELAGSSCLSCYFLITAVRRQALREKILFSALSCLFACSFMTSLYPPFQVPIGWAILAALVSVWSSSNFAFHRGVILHLFLIAAPALSLTVLYYLDVAESLSLLAGTSYPGRRLFTGGGMDWQELFRGFYSPLWSEYNYPRNYGNICEAGSFIFIFPLILTCVLLNTPSLRQIRAVLPAAACIAFLIIYMTAGFPRWLAAATGLSFVTPNRAVAGLGLADMFLAAAFFKIRNSLPRRGTPVALFAVTTWILLNFFILHGELPALPGPEVSVLLALLALAGISIAGNVLRLSAIASVSLAAFFFINPLSQGLSPILKSPEFKFAREIERLFPDKRLLVPDDVIVSRILAAAGVNVISGSSLIPDLEMYRRIDPGEKNIDVYNRFAHVSFSIGTQTTFVTEHPDRIHIEVPGCTGLKLMAVDLILAPENMDIPAITGCTDEIKEPALNGWRLLKTVN